MSKPIPIVLFEILITSPNGNSQYAQRRKLAWLWKASQKGMRFTIKREVFPSGRVQYKVII